MKLIVNADDFGISHGCNLAIIDCFKDGIITSTSMMVNMPYAEEAASLWKENPDLSVGIHITLTAGRPLTEAASLIKENGNFNKETLSGKIPVDYYDMKQEAEAQIDRFVELNGRLPDHINSHHGIEMIPGGKKLLQELSKKYDLPIRAFINGKENEEYFVDYKVPQLFFTPSFDSNKEIKIEDIIKNFNSDLIKSNDLVELGGHPGYIDKELLDLSSLTLGRAYDADIFKSQELRDWIENNKVELITYKDIPKVI